MTETTETNAPEPNQETELRDVTLQVEAIDLCKIIATLDKYAEAPHRALHEVFNANLVDGDRERAMRETHHFPPVRDWVAANLDQAAMLVLVAVYLRGGRCLVQSAVEQPQDAAPESQPPQEAQEAPSEG